MLRDNFLEGTLSDASDLLARPLAGMVIDELLSGRAVEIVSAVMTQHGLGIGRLPSPHREDAGCVAFAPSSALGNGGGHVVRQWPDQIRGLRKSSGPVRPQHLDRRAG